MSSSRLRDHHSSSRSSIQCACVDRNSIVCSSSATPQRKAVAEKRKLDLMKTTPSSVPLPSLHLQCSCSYESHFVYSSPSSPRVGDTKELYVPFEINASMTLYATQIGKRHEALETMKAALRTENMQQKTFIRHKKKTKTKQTKTKIQAACEKNTTEQLQSAAEAVCSSNPNENGDGVLDITVSFDGTWQKRGFSSHHGAGVAIEVQTGLVIDFEVLSTYCHSCSLARPRLGKTLQIGQNGCTTILTDTNRFTKGYGSRVSY